MRLSRFLTPLDLRVLLLGLGRTLLLQGAIFAVPALVALTLGEPRLAVIFLGLALGSAALGAPALRRPLPVVETKEALAITALGYLVLALTGSLAYLPSLPWLDGLFESMSGFTTTGLTVVDPARLSPGVSFFRAYTQWIGGAGIAVLSLAVLRYPLQAALNLYALERGEERLVGNLKQTARIVMTVYAALTVVAFLLYWASGVRPWVAALHALTSLSTGGFSTHADSALQFSGVATRAVFVTAMLLGATCFADFYRARREGLSALTYDPQLRLLLVLVVVGGGLIYLSDPGGPGRLLDGCFLASSAATTTGYSLAPTAASATLVILVLMLIGGSAGSTAGGLKLVRVLILGRVVYRWLIRALLPREARIPLTYRGVAVEDEEVGAIAAFAALYLATWLMCAVALTFTGASLERSLFESASALGTVGLSAGVTSPALAGWAKLLLTVEMWAGRLELLPVLVLAHPRLWVRRQRRATKEEGL